MSLSINIHCHSNHHCCDTLSTEPNRLYHHHHHYATKRPPPPYPLTTQCWGAPPTRTNHCVSLAVWVPATPPTSEHGGCPHVVVYVLHPSIHLSIQPSVCQSSLHPCVSSPPLPPLSVAGERILICPSLHRVDVRVSCVLFGVLYPNCLIM